jgi:hypothetical protein
MAQHVRAVPEYHHTNHPRGHLLLSCKPLQHQDGGALLQCVWLQLREAGREGAEDAVHVGGQPADDRPGTNASQAAQAAEGTSGRRDDWQHNPRSLCVVGG